MMLLGNWSRIDVLFGPDLVVAGLKMSLPNTESEKFPLNSLLVGTRVRLTDCCRAAKCSYAKKKKVLFRPSYLFGMYTGPPNVPPNWICLYGGVWVIRACVIGFRAVNLLLRTNSHNDPVTRFPPDRVTALIVAPKKPPNSALSLCD